MKKARKGFTLAELLIVIGIIAVLGAMGLIGGKEANNIATATKIVEDFHVISAAMNMYYADNKSKIDADGGKEINAAKILDAIGAYLKDTNKIVDVDTDDPSPGQFYISLIPAEENVPLQWWLTYMLDDGEGGVAKILANKAKQENFKFYQQFDDEDAYYTAGDGKEVCYRVR